MNSIWRPASNIELVNLLYSELFHPKKKLGELKNFTIQRMHCPASSAPRIFHFQLECCGVDDTSWDFSIRQHETQQWMDITRRITIDTVGCGRCCDGKVKALELTRISSLFSSMCAQSFQLWNESHGEHDNGDKQKFFIRCLIKNVVYNGMFIVGGSFLIASIIDSAVPTTRKAPNWISNCLNNGRRDDNQQPRFHSLLFARRTHQTSFNKDECTRSRFNEKRSDEGRQSEWEIHYSTIDKSESQFFLTLSSPPSYFTCWQRRCNCG